MFKSIGVAAAAAIAFSVSTAPAQAVPSVEATQPHPLVIPASKVPLSNSVKADTEVGDVVCSDGDPQYKDLSFTLYSSTINGTYQATVHNRVHYHTCFKKKAMGWQVRIRLRRVQGGYEISKPNHKNHCKSMFSNMEYISFNYYFWDKTGRNYNPSEKRLSCQADGWNEFTLDLGDAPDLIVNSDGPPWWRDSSKMVINNSDDDYGSAHGQMTAVL